MIICGLQGVFYDPFCRSGDSLVDVIEDAALVVK
jgi:hypothetical protein